LINEFYLAVVFIFGAVFGSFLNVCIYRLPRSGMSIIKPSSRCPKCERPIRWFDNIPLLSYLLLLGRCRHCKNPISLRYPLVELLTALLFTFAFAHHFSGTDPITRNTIVGFAISIYLIAALIVITFIDFEFRIIPDEISLSGIVIALIVSLAFPSIISPLWFFNSESTFVTAFVPSLFVVVTGGLLIYLVGVFGKIIFRKEAMGFGDVKLMAMLGGFMGWEAVLYVFFLGCLFGAVVGIISWMVTKDHYLAFGPYLALGALVMIFFGPEIKIFTTQTYPEFIRNLLAH
jgi:leader peptidase (prepilin peptidase)/N-methyltransferase